MATNVAPELKVCSVFNKPVEAVPQALVQFDTSIIAQVAGNSTAAWQ